MQGERTLKVAVIGLGWVATKRHIPVILRSRRLHLYGVVDRHEARVQGVRKQHPSLKVALSDQAEIPWLDEIQVVAIATDPLSHYSIAKKMLLAGKHVLVEKPLAMRPDEGADLQEIVAGTNVSCCVVHNFQFARSSVKLRSLIQAGRLGEIRCLEAVQLSNPRRRLPAWYERLPLGLFYDESPHMLYMLESLAGQGLRLLSSAILGEPGRNTPLSVTAAYMAGRIPIHLHMNFAASLSEWHIAVMGTKNTAIIDLFRDILVMIPNDGSHRARDIMDTSRFAIASHLQGFVQSGLLLAGRRLFYGVETVWDRFVTAILKSTSPAEISVGRGRRVVEMQHELLANSVYFQRPPS